MNINQISIYNELPQFLIWTGGFSIFICIKTEEYFMLMLSPLFYLVYKVINELLSWFGVGLTFFKQ